MTSTIAPTSTHSATTTAPLSGKGDLPPNEPPKHVPRQQDGPSDTSEHNDEEETVLALSGRHSELVPPLSTSCGDPRMHEDELDDGESMIDFCYEESDKETKKAAQHDLAAPSVPSDADVSSHPDAEVSQKSIGRLWRFRMFCGAIVNHEYVQIGIIILIVLNALMMGLATFDFAVNNPRVEELFNQIDLGFLVIFTIECAAQLIYLGWTLFADGWLLFDFVIVLLSWSFDSLQIVRAFRIFRAFRLVTRVKPLRDLVLAIGSVMPRIYAIASLLGLVFYIFSVLFTELFSTLPLSYPYFTRLDTSLFTCMQMMTLEWGDLAREVMDYNEWAWAPFLAFIMTSGFIVFNLIIAVICDAVSVTEKHVRELDGFEPDNPEHQLRQAMERIDLLQLHINDMLKTQGQVQELIEMMASELLNLEAERMKAEHQGADLRISMHRRKDRMQSPEQIEALERKYVQEKERRLQERQNKRLQSQESLRELEEKEKSQRMIGVPIPGKALGRGRSADGSLTESSHRSTRWADISSKSLPSFDDTNVDVGAKPKGPSVAISSRKTLMHGDF